jgi:CRP/FNR family transcriptional regulator
LKKDEEGNSFDGQMILRSYKKKQAIFYEGHPALGVFFVQSGRIKVYKMGANGKPHILFIAQEGDYLGVESVLGRQDFSSTGELLEEGLVGFISREKFFELLSKDTLFSIELAKSLAKRVNLGDEERVNLAESSVRERMARSLMNLSQSFGVSMKEGTLIDLKLSREDLANLVGTAFGTALRQLKEFKEDQVVLLKKKYIIVRDPAYLEKLAHLA